MTKASELREMSDEQLGFTLKESAESLFRLRIKAQTERLNAPSELRKARRTIARTKTIQTERARLAAASTSAAEKPAAVAKPAPASAAATAKPGVGGKKAAAGAKKQGKQGVK
jgi:large subunit ribosomal protein L29